MLISVVVPLYNEADNLPELTDRLRKVLDGCDSDWEVILIDDGSQDGSWDFIESVHRKDPRFQGIQLTRNFGQQPALMAGLRHAGGDVVIPMDADLQDPPEVIGKLIEKWQEGFQVVYAIRQHRKEGWLRNWSAGMFYRILQRFTHVKIAIDSGDFCLLDRQVVDVLCRFTEQHPFLRGLRSWVGFRQTGVTFDRGMRFKGGSKYSIRGLMKLAFDGIFALSGTPVRFVTYLGMIVVILSIMGVVWSIWGVSTADSNGNISLFAITLLLLIGGVQLMVLGVIGEFVHRIFDEVRGRPIYIIGKTLSGTLRNSDARGINEE